MKDFTLTVQEIAEYLIATSGEEGDITNFKLQRLLYYAHGFHIAMFNKETLFEDPILAAPHGPVVTEVFDFYADCGYGKKIINPVIQINVFDYPPEVVEILEAVKSNYGQYSAWKLREMVQEEDPWKTTAQGNEITVDSLYEYFIPIVLAGSLNAAVGNRPIWPMNSFQHKRRREIMARHASCHNMAKLREIAHRNTMTLKSRSPAPDDWE